MISPRVSALYCLECTSPVPTRLDENRTVSGPFPDHLFGPSLVPAQQRWQNHPGSQRTHPTVARTAWVESRNRGVTGRIFLSLRRDRTMAESKLFVGNVE